MDIPSHFSGFTLKVSFPEKRVIEMRLPCYNLASNVSLYLHSATESNNDIPV